MKGRLEWREAVVAAVAEIATGIRSIEFAVGGGTPRFDPGSHLNVEVTIAGRRHLRTYTCLPAGPGRLRIAVKRHHNSRGGSRFMWSLQPGEPVRLSLPENRFELSWRGNPVLLMAGGIGITPIYGMAVALAQRGRAFRLAYAGAARGAMAFADDLAALGGDIEFYVAAEGRRLDVAAEIGALAADGELYVCGPLRLLDAARAAWADAGRPPGRLRYEVFGDSGRYPETAFEVSVPSRGMTVPVRPDQTMLDALLAAGVDMVYDCQRGECGLCAVTVLDCDGDIDHRDVFFSDEERRHGRRLCACVSRVAGGRAVIDTGHRA